jgi:leader peptidase (prepilin peptidase)/N-methyltransferase
VTGRLRPSTASRKARGAVLGAAIAAGLAVTIAGSPPWALLAVAVVLLGVVGVWLAVIDLRTHLLPDWLLLPTCLTVATLLVLSWVGEGDARTLLRAAASAVVTLIVYTAMSRWGSLGFGDVKLGALLALVLGWAGWSAALAGPVLGFVLGAVVAVVLLASGRGSKTHLAFGPYLIAGALIVLIRQLVATAG